MLTGCTTGAVGPTNKLAGWLLQLAGFASKICSSSQRGFLPGRHLLENVIDIDIEARRLLISDKKGAVILVDLTAAFPSLSQDFLFSVLEKQGVPGSIRGAIRQFYNNNVHEIEVDRESSPSFTVTSGVRQGCPMSPVLFALALDPFLDYLKGHIPKDSLIKAYADDMAVSITEVSHLTRLTAPFELLKEAANLEVNVSKTVLVPCFSASEEELRERLAGTQEDGDAMDVDAEGDDRLRMLPTMGA